MEKDEEIDHIESFGYENYYISQKDNIYFLKPKFKDIEGVEISKPKFTQSYIIGSLKEDNFGFMSGLRTWEVLNFFANKDKTEKNLSKRLKYLQM